METTFVCEIKMAFSELPIQERGSFRLLDGDIPDHLRNYLNEHIFGFVEPPVTVTSYEVHVFDYEDGTPGGTIELDIAIRVPQGTTINDVERYINEIFAKDINVNSPAQFTQGRIIGGATRSKKSKRKSRKPKRKSRKSKRV